MVIIHTFFGCCWHDLILMLIHSLVPHVTFNIEHLLHNIIFIYCITRIFNYPVLSLRLDFNSAMCD